MPKTGRFRADHKNGSMRNSCDPGCGSNKKEKENKWCWLWSNLKSGRVASQHLGIGGDVRISSFSSSYLILGFPYKERQVVMQPLPETWSPRDLDSCTELWHNPDNSTMASSSFYCETLALQLTFSAAWPPAPLPPPPWNRQPPPHTWILFQKFTEACSLELRRQFLLKHDKWRLGSQVC